MELRIVFFALIEIMFVIKSGYAYTVPLRSYTLNRYRPSSAIPRQCETPVLKNGSVRLRQRGRLIRYNCLPSFTLIGDKYSSCNQGQWDNHVPMCIKSGCPSIERQRNGFVYAEKNGAISMLFCSPGFSIAGNNVTFCNGTNWDRSLGTCRETQASPVLICDFEVANICDWEADPTHDFEWVRKNGYTSVKQLQTGPAHDNTVGVPLEGHFMLATLASQLPGAVARLISPLYPAEASKDACFRLYYHMYGALHGVLRIYVKPKSVTLTEMLETSKYLYSEKNGSFENAWLESVFNIDEYMEEFQIVIEATAARTSRSNIAIDDVALLSGSDCLNEEFKSTTVVSEEGGIFDAESCANRCMERAPYSRYVTETIVIQNKTVNILQCDCYDGCEDRNSCCLDYRSVCVFDLSTAYSTESELITGPGPHSIIPTANSTYPGIYSTLSSSSFTAAAISTTTLPPTTKTSKATKTVNTKPTSTIKIITPTTSTTSSMISSKSIPTVTTSKIIISRPTIKVPTSKINTYITPMIATTASTTKGTTPVSSEKSTKSNITSTVTPVTKCNQKKECDTLYVTGITTEAGIITEAVEVITEAAGGITKAAGGITEAAVGITEAAGGITKAAIGFTESVGGITKSLGGNTKDTGSSTRNSDGVIRYWLISFGISLIVAIIGVVIVKLYRGHRDRFNYKSKRYSQDASDEVRFLTAEEQLDFTMQKEDK